MEEAQARCLPVVSLCKRGASQQGVQGQAEDARGKKVLRARRHSGRSAVGGAPTCGPISATLRRQACESLQRVRVSAAVVPRKTLKSEICRGDRPPRPGRNFPCPAGAPRPQVARMDAIPLCVVDLRLRVRKRAGPPHRAAAALWGAGRR